MHKMPENIGCIDVFAGLPSCHLVAIGSRPLIAADRCAQQTAPVMNAELSPTSGGAQPLKIVCNPPPTDAPKTRVAVFGSFLGGYHVL